MDTDLNKSYINLIDKGLTIDNAKQFAFFEMAILELYKTSPKLSMNTGGYF